MFRGAYCATLQPSPFLWSAAPLKSKLPTQKRIDAKKSLPPPPNTTATNTTATNMMVLVVQMALLLLLPVSAAGAGKQKHHAKRAQTAQGRRQPLS